MRLVPCSPPAGIAYDALVDAPVTSIASALLAQVAAARDAHDARAEPAWQAYWDLSEESGPYYLCAEPAGDDVADRRRELRGEARASTWYRIDVQDELDARTPGVEGTSAHGGVAHGGVAHGGVAHGASVCLVGRWRRGEPAPVLYARETVQARVRAHGARRAAAVRAASAAGAAAGDRLVGHGVADA